MKRVIIEQNRCPQNHWCPIMRVCPVGAISQDSPFNAPIIDEEKCTHCGKCARYCAYGAFSMAEQSS
ncbi:MAG TPA: 4Fe-4S ferredoxin [Marinilabiliales bacterium]|jgi:Fe-S-cluster-containing hydrogenase component 2|nr:MAG: 4Fe-4S ferredoxin [Bacteroidetes bacterium GWA2_40_14]OFX56683.1 MAG: 4Fe-4S ferredoxin [Bacteroidetes bacterium GWC2_40_13]OFX72410.1 MAG: 4Fe-4S ferredoxin [Bacteroidetes bacterium GWD2_40_43]OFX95313.1 MAG: 4Fe-4S ferredoxin [Bacteroidetes bacterium GWE2_40_63]OFY21865.1 MAG: 4Fe-4S ferredoxin [Bacteroidetes bacterium GWF2_40_13]OFZ26126.1 MAG: 4Fe-4S ferredoxin [Bacteroidetes bacterium RIFOXYC2_FULL_40_12]HAM99867.1 4Fe-4S ferredoxin [Marinilabiliales bacterium]